jgi:hypothetical protein
MEILSGLTICGEISRAQDMQNGESVQALLEAVIPSRRRWKTQIPSPKSQAKLKQAQNPKIS